jgi:hypothetical protein
LPTWAEAMRDPIVIGARRKLVALLPILVLAAWAATASDAATISALLVIALGTASAGWLPTPWREASDDFLLVRGIATRHGLAFRRLVLGLAPIAMMLGVIAVLRAVGRAEAQAPLAHLALAAGDPHLIVAATAVTVSLAIALGHVDTILAIATVAGAPPALASLFRAPVDARSERRARTSPGETPALGEWSPSSPLRALVRVALRPALGRNPSATFFLVLTTHVTASFLALTPFLTSSPKLLSRGSFIVCTLLVMMIGWAVVRIRAAKVRHTAGHGQLEWLLARPLSRATLAAGGALAAHLALLGIVAVGFVAATAYAASRGRPAPAVIAAVAFLLLASVEFGVAALGVLSAARRRGAIARAMFLPAPFVLPLVLALPELERGARGEAAVLAPWAFATGAPWIVANAPFVLFALLVASALAHALAYRSFRAYEL